MGLMSTLEPVRRFLLRHLRFTGVLDRVLRPVEHVIKVILGVSSRVVVLNFGEKIFEGLPTEAVNDQRVIEAYLGEDFHA